jgi:DNA-directed RNA polymerase specialized sigma24 family protein/ribosome-associated translation inhibitor RaiA
MQVHFTYHNGSASPQLEKIVETNVRKLSDLLVRFSPDLIHLHGLVEFGTPKSGPSASVNLWLPTAQLHSTEQGKDVPAVLRAAFTHIRDQVKKHKEVLRREGEWKRKRYRGKRQDQKTQDGEVSLKDRQQVRDYLDLVLPQLKQFVARELRYQELSGLCAPTPLQQEEVVDEVVANTLENHAGFSAEATPFHSLVAQAIRVLNGAVDANGTAGDQAEGSRPGDLDQVELCLALLPPKKRQVYVLHALEGFSFDETAGVLGQMPSEVEEAFREVSQQVSVAVRNKARGSH